MSILKHMYTTFGCSSSELHAPRNVWPVNVVLQEPQYLLIVYVLVSSELSVSVSSPSFVALNLPVSDIVKCTAVGCLFSRTTTMFTVVILVYSLKSSCIRSFIFIGFYVSELHAHLCPYHNVWLFIVVNPWRACASVVCWPHSCVSVCVSLYLLPLL